GGEEADESGGDRFRFLQVQPMGSLVEPDEFGGCALPVAHTGERRMQKRILSSPQNACRDLDAPYPKAARIAKQSAVPVDHCRNGSGLRPGCTIPGQVFGRKRSRPARSEKGSSTRSKVPRGEQQFGYSRHLKEEHVPAPAELSRMRKEKPKHHTRMWHVQDG